MLRSFPFLSSGLCATDSVPAKLTLREKKKKGTTTITKKSKHKLTTYTLTKKMQWVYKSNNLL